MMIKNLLPVFVLFGVPLCNGARILAVFPFEMKSHYNVLEPITKELAKKGHHVDVITPFSLSMELPNYKQIITLPALENPPKLKFSHGYRPIDDIPWLSTINQKVCDLLGHPDVSKLIKNPPKDPPYDLLIVHILSGYQCFSAIGVAWNIPIVGVVTTMVYPQMLHYLNIPLSLATQTRHSYFYKENLNFWDRVHNVLVTNVILHYYQADHRENQDYYIKKYLGPNMPSYSEIEKSYSLILSNSHYLYHGIKAQPPGLIEIGGINIKNDSSPWDPKLKKLLDESKDGFIYFSFGSLIVVESFEPQVLDKFYKVIRNIAPIRVILKSSNPQALPKNLPSNVFTFPWLPQQKVLQHPNIKAFVTHGGGLGMNEAIYYKVPMVCVPFFAEQYINCDISSAKNFSLKLNLHTAEQEDYDYVFTQILTNPVYKQTIDKFSALYWDRPLSPRESVTYWIEFVLRHGKNALRTQGLDLKWWQLELFDVYAFLIVCISVILFIFIFIVRRIFKYCLKRLKVFKQMKLSKKFE